MSNEMESPNNAGRSQGNPSLDHLAAEPTILNITKAWKNIDSLKTTLGRVSLRVACVGSFTFDPIRPALELQGVRAGFAITTHLSPYGQFEQELINPDSGLSKHEPELVLLALRLQDVCPTLYESFVGLSANDCKVLVDGWIDRLRTALLVFRERSNAHVLIQNYDMPPTFALGPADRSATVSQPAVITRANDALRELAGSLDNVHIMDYDSLVAQHGRLDWQDPRTAFFGRIPVAAKHYWHLAGFYIRHMRPLFGLSKKVLVLDADNTLWGGVVGDVGLDGIALGHDYPGNAFVAFQKRILDLHNRGIVLCIASKNEPGNVEEVLDKHPGMILRREHFAAMRVNWASKPENIQQMAADLNLGMDAFVFIDDSHVECELMRAALPQILSVHLPSEPADYPAIVESLDCFDQWSVSAEDRKRGKLYKSQVERQTLKATAVDMPTFYRQLEMKATIFVDEASHVARASQMTNRTNQFNMHTIRCSEDDIRGFLADKGVSVVTLVLEDRFGDNGIVGLAVVRQQEGEWILHMFLMSCRVLGRTVEQAFVGWIAARAREAGAERLVAEFVPTVKNRPFAGFFKDRGFVEAEPAEDIEDTIRWIWPLKTADTETPDWLTIRLHQEKRE